MSYIYKTTCLINGKIYIGQSNREFDKDLKYIGSGSLIKSAILKYGKINFCKELLRICESQRELDIWEQIYIKKFKSCDRNIGYNILPGTSNKFGAGSPMSIPEVAEKCSESNKKFFSSFEGKVVKEKISKLMKQKWEEGMFAETSAKTKFTKNDERLLGENNPNYGNNWTDEQKKANSDKMKGRFVGERNANYGNKWSDKKRKEFSKKLKKQGLRKGVNNGRFGKYCITDGIVNKIIQKEDQIPEGWHKGMTQKRK